MRKIAATLLTLMMLTGHSIPAFGWGDAGHKTVGQVAQLRLANTNTLVRIKQILMPGETLANIATWADRVKTESRFSPQATNPDPDTQDFYRRMVNQHNRGWHFVDLPLGCSSYNNCPQFQKKTDIVQMISLCIHKLRGDNVPQLTPRNALRLLVHLVGDLHQPLHVGVGFINVNGPNDTIVIERDPATILQSDFPSDIGANKLLIKGEDSDNLHSFWDSDLVEEARGDQSIVEFAQSLNITPPSSWDSQGNAYTWAAQWATDTLRVSRDNAYDSTIRVKKEVVIDDETKYLIIKGNNYTSKNVLVVKQQLAKGGYRLAKLLQAIFP
ncbi:MAG TPA: S1/P1 nuclease [Pyrinomonadaceae bacterium]|jgi:hypothetical protein